MAARGPRVAALLRVLAEVCEEQGLVDESRRALARLHEAFPYSEDAALARERWGAGPMAQVVSGQGGEE